jgi:hypothetical protein
MKTIRILLLNIIFLASVTSAMAQAAPAKTRNLVLVGGMQSMEYRFMLFKTPSGDTLCAKPIDTCLTPTGYQNVWDSDGPPVYILAQYQNKTFTVTYTPLTDTTIYAQGQPPYQMDIKKLELLK